MASQRQSALRRTENPTVTRSSSIPGELSSPNARSVRRDFAFAPCSRALCLSLLQEGTGLCFAVCFQSSVDWIMCACVCRKLMWRR